jgi:transposase
MIPVPSGVRVWIATGHTDMRRGMNGLALQVQHGLKRDPHAGDMFVFRGRRGDLIKILWHDGLGMSLYAKRLERGRFIWPSPAACPCCGGKLAKLGEDVTETLEVVPRQWKVVQTVREKFTCRSCEKITQPPAPFHTIARGRAGASLLAMILYAKYGHHQPLNRQSESFAREGIGLDVSTMADWVGACTAALAPLVTLIRLHVLGAARLHGDDTTVPVLATGKTVTGRVWAYVRDDRPFAGTGSPRRGVLLFPQPRRRAPEAASGWLYRDSSGRRLWRVQWSLRSQAQSRPDYRGSLLEPRTAEVLCPGRYRQVCSRQGTAGTTRRRRSAPDRRDLCDRG